jgi:hypothetical protein
MQILNDLLRNTKILMDADIIWNHVFSDKDFQVWILDLIRDDQLTEKGVNEDGQIIGVYTRYTEELTNGRKKAGEPYNLFDTGDFYKSMVILLGTNYFEIDADPIKENANLFTKYGEGIIGLTEESLEKLREETKRRYAIEIDRLFSLDL